MAKRSTRRKSSSRPPKQQAKKTPTAKQVALPKAAEVVGFSEVEEEFFRAGENADALEHEDNVYAAPSFWRRLFSREQHAS